MLEFDKRGTSIIAEHVNDSITCEKARVSDIMLLTFILTFQSFGGRPFVFVSAKYTRDTKSKDAMYIWLENVNSRSFEVCIREFLPFDGKHQDTIVVGNI